MTKNDFRIVFMGTPEFAQTSLDFLLEEGYAIKAVITAPDKPAGRGKKKKESAVKKFAAAKELPVWQPVNLKSQTFLDELKAIRPDLIVVVAFRMLPEEVWRIPTCGTINLHASLLPQYRGAAPINHAIINGETSTGITTFFIEKQIDTGNIILQKEVPIHNNENAGDVHDKLMNEGAVLLKETIDLIIKKSFKPLIQKDLYTADGILKTAPKIFKQDCIINFEQKSKKVYDFIRGLSPYPGAYTFLTDDNGKQTLFKIFSCTIIDGEPTKPLKTINSDNKNYIRIYCKEGGLELNEVQIEGKKRMSVKEFLNGFDIYKYTIT